jgi:hypothetical protein
MLGTDRRIIVALEDILQVFVNPCGALVIGKLQVKDIDYLPF